MQIGRGGELLQSHLRVQDDEQCALVEMVFKSFCIKLLTDRGMLPETARIFAAKAVKLDPTSDGDEETSKP